MRNGRQSLQQGAERNNTTKKEEKEKRERKPQLPENI
jgi:hypothetical protein